MDGVTACSHQALSFTGGTQRPRDPGMGWRQGTRSPQPRPLTLEGAPDRCGGILVPTVVFLGAGESETTPQGGHGAPTCFSSRLAHMLRTAPAFTQSEELVLPSPGPHVPGNGASRPALSLVTRRYPAGRQPGLWQPCHRPGGSQVLRRG